MNVLCFLLVLATASMSPSMTSSMSPSMTPSMSPSMTSTSTL